MRFVKVWIDFRRPPLNRLLRLETRTCRGSQYKFYTFHRSIAALKDRWGMIPVKP